MATQAQIQLQISTASKFNFTSNNEGWTIIRICKRFIEDSEIETPIYSKIEDALKFRNIFSNQISEIAAFALTIDGERGLEIQDLIDGGYQKYIIEKSFR
jgi:hypothetical protein